MIIRMEGRALARLRRFLRGGYLTLFVAGAILLAVPIYHSGEHTYFRRIKIIQFRKHAGEVPEPKEGRNPSPGPGIETRGGTPETDAATPESPPPSGPNRSFLPSHRPAMCWGGLKYPGSAHSVMILQGTEDEQLKLGIGHVEDTAHPGQVGNIALVAHRDTFFRPARTFANTMKSELSLLTTTMRYYVE